MLSAATRARLEQTLREYEQQHAHQVVVHITPSLEGLSIEDYSLRVAEAWKIGHAKLDNGVILTVAPEERKVRIEVGYGLEGVLPDAIANRIIREQILPAFRAGQLERGIVAGSEAILQVISGEALALPETAHERNALSREELRALLWLLFVLLAFGWRGWFFLPFLDGGRGGPAFGGGRGGGGFRGGGGRFGGGGASGSW